MFGKGSELKKGKDSKPTSLRNTSENTKKKGKTSEYSEGCKEKTGSIWD